MKCLALCMAALVVDAPAVIVDESIETQRRYADAAAASLVLSGAESSPPLVLSGAEPSPPPTIAFPVCAIPGWWPGNDRAEFYDDTTVFRPASASIEAASRSTDSQSACAPAPVNSSALP